MSKTIKMAFGAVRELFECNPIIEMRLLNFLRLVIVAAIAGVFRIGFCMAGCTRNVTISAVIDRKIVFH